MTETRLSGAIAKALRKLGYPVIRIQAGQVRVGRSYVHMADRGTPDRLVLLRGGRVLWLEVKTPSGILSSDQVAWHANAGRLGHVVRVVRSVSDAIAAIREADHERFNQSVSGHRPASSPAP